MTRAVQAQTGETKVPGWCALCRSRCGCFSIVKEGRLVRIEADPSHPTGRALCAKGQAAPEQVYSDDRLLYPMKRTRPKDEVDPGWVRISWDEALDTIAAQMTRIAAESGPESVAFALTTPSGTAISDSLQWVERLLRVFGSSNNCYGTEICNWHKDHATEYTYGVGIGRPDLDQAGCILLWGHNPNTSWLAQAQRVSEARRRGASIVVVDPRRAGPAIKADQWLQIRPGTDGALALGIAWVMLSESGYDHDFVHRWTNAPLLIHESEGRLLTASDIGAPEGAERYVGWDQARSAPVVMAANPAQQVKTDWLLTGEVTVDGPRGAIVCRPVFDHYYALCAEWSPERTAEVTGVPADQIRDTARLLWASRPVSYYAWSGVGQHTNATQTDRAISILYSLLGSIGSSGGNQQPAGVPLNDVSGHEFVTDVQRSKTLGLQERPLGPPKNGWCTSRDLYHSILEGEPYRVRALLGFGQNLIISHGGVERGIEALKALEFHVQTDIFLTPTASYADIVLPVNTAWERDSLRVGFEITDAANGWVQFRHAAVESAGESHDDGWMVFELAKRLGLADLFWGGDMDAAWREWLAPSGVELDELKRNPRGIQLAVQTPLAPHLVDGFKTPTGRIEIWSHTFQVHGQDPLPVFVEPHMSPVSRKELLKHYPLVLGSAKSHRYCHSQHRNLAALRRLQKDPLVEIHPQTAAGYGIAPDDWVMITTPQGGIRARAVLKSSLRMDTVFAQHGWWQACEPLGLAAAPASGEGSTNFNLLIDNEVSDPISGSVAHRSYLCNIERVDT